MSVARDERTEKGSLLSVRTGRGTGGHFRTVARFGSGFTLVEIVIAITIVVILTAAAVPSFRGFRDEQMAREPVVALARMAKEARIRAMEERRPYQVAFHAGGFTASRHFNPYLQMVELNEFIQGMDAGMRGPQDDGEEGDPDFETVGSASTQLPLAPPPPSRDDQWNETYKLPPDTRYSVQFWHDLQPVSIEADMVKLWVFQPSGICQPLTIHMERDSATFRVEFGSLTADIVREVIDLR